jgi:hypothetical protein
MKRLPSRVEQEVNLRWEIKGYHAKTPTPPTTVIILAWENWKGRNVVGAGYLHFQKRRIRKPFE